MLQPYPPAAIEPSRSARPETVATPIADGADGAETDFWRAHGIYARDVKPAIDRVLAVAFLLFFIPVLLSVAVIARLSLGGGGVLFRQNRVGLDGHEFTLLKFRTMRPDRRTAQRPIDGPDRRQYHKSQKDPRHTRVGRFLRKYSFDELPQLWNVVRGDMSLVGPRPELPSIVRGYDVWQHARHYVRPGMTGLWQVTARGDGAMHLFVDVDLEYVRKVSPVQDFQILLRTLPAAALRRTGS